MMGGVSISVLYFLISVDFLMVSSNQSAQNAIVGSKICIKVLGCFEITSDFFDLIRRPINVLPQDRPIINTRLFVYTKDSPIDAFLLDADNKAKVEASPIKKGDCIKFIVHGYIDMQNYGTWHEVLKNYLLLAKKPCVIIIVDWTGGNSLPYTQAVANTRVVGAEIEHAIRQLEKIKNVKPEDCHIIGHSLGAHVAGYAGARNPRIGRITGLDPAEPYFQDLPPSVRLDETDAQFVDVIHTDSKSIFLLGLGMSQPCGHLDFYPNGGEKQPGCERSKLLNLIAHGLIGGGRHFIGCNHERAVDFYTFSVLHNKCSFVGYQCASWANFLEGKCTECGPDGGKCAMMGERAIESKGFKQVNMKLYVKTADRRPYCLHHFQIIIKLRSTKKSRDMVGNLEIMLNGLLADLGAVLMKGAVDLIHGSSYTYLVTTEKDLGELKSVTLTWKDASSILNPLNWLSKKEIFVDYVKVVPMNVIDKGTKLAQTYTFCMTDKDRPISSRKLTVISNRQNC